MIAALAIDAAFEEVGGTCAVGDIKLPWQMRDAQGTIHSQLSRCSDGYRRYVIF